MGERWKGVVDAFCGPSNTRSKVMASLCCSRETGCLLVPSSNAIFLVGDRVEHTDNQVIRRLSQLDTIASVLVSKLGETVNAWVVEPSLYHANFACYHNLIPSLTASGEPLRYNPHGFPAARGLLALQLDCLAQVTAELRSGRKTADTPARHQQEELLNKQPPPTVLLGFSKGGVVLNQLLAEFASLNGQQHLAEGPPPQGEEHTLVPTSAPGFLRSVRDIHFVDVGLNCRGAYQTEPEVLEAVAKVAATRPHGLTLTLHGTPRQWKDQRRLWIGIEKDRCVALLQTYATKFGDGKLHVEVNTYFPHDRPSLQMHFQIIDSLIV